MPGFRRARFLTCFYCNSRTSTQYDGRTRRFECPRCDATNYLDEHGDITDPPVATTGRESPPVRYAAARGSVSPTLSKSADAPNSIFCKTCLQNQHLFTASLAQYLPDDPDDPDYADRDKKYFRFRKNLEQRYPQICADCEPRVRARMDQASYTAKTDLLRRMIDRTNEGRKVKRRGWLDRFDVLGKWLWVAGLVLQLLWHASLLIELANSYLVQYQAPWVPEVLEISNRIVQSLPTDERLVSMSMAASISSVWWNPRFVQTYRGFTKHIHGLPYWYGYQVMAILIRSIFAGRLGLASQDPTERPMRVAGHLSALAFTVSLYTIGPRSIRTDTTPLFKPSPRRTTFQHVPQQDSGDDENKNMSEILHEILHSKPKPAKPSAADFGHPSPAKALNGFGKPPATRPSLNSREDSSLRSRSLNPSCNTASVSPISEDEDKMDWSPTQSQHRAFNTLGQRQTTRFGEVPTEPQKGPFWYRVPPAPVSQERQLRNPPNAPRLRQSPCSVAPAKAKGNPFARREGDSQMVASTGESIFATRKEDREGDDHSAVTFKPPSFFSQQLQTEQVRNDPRNSLSDMFGSSFSLDQDQMAQESKSSDSWFSGLLKGPTKREKRN